MFHRKRFRSAIAIILTLLLAVALAPVASAVNGLPPPPAPPAEVTPDPDPEPPVPGPDPTDPPPPTVMPDPNGNGDMNGDKNGDMMNGDMDEDMMSTPSSHSWPPPNAIVRHAATPVQISAHGGALNVYFIAADGAVISGPVIASFSDLDEMHAMGAAVSLYSGMNPGTGKSVEITYLPDEMKIRVSTYYADKPPHDYNKPYVFTVDADHSVNHERW